jgi:hypothetical protein
VARSPELVADPAVVVLRWSADAREAIDIYAFLAMQVVAGCTASQPWVYSAQPRRPATPSVSLEPAHAPKPHGQLVHVPTCRPPSAPYDESP